MAAISLQDVGKRFGRSEAVRNVSFDIRDGEFAVFVGPSGCGKSTMLRLIAGLEDASNGRIAFDGKDVTSLPPADRGIAMVFQSYALYPHMNVYDNMAFGLKLAKTDRIIVLNEGRVEQIGAPLELYHHPHNLFVAGFIGSPKMNFLPCTVTAIDAKQVTLSLSSGHSIIAAVSDTARLHPQAKVTLGLRPEDLTDSIAEKGQLEGEVIALEHLGAETYAYLACGNDEPLVIKSAGDSAIKIGQRVPVAVPPKACYLFDETGAELPQSN
jgi:ABC-type sugar transport system ATPase subunit